MLRICPKPMIVKECIELIPYIKSLKVVQKKDIIAIIEKVKTKQS